MVNQNTLHILSATQSHVAIVILQILHTVMYCEKEVFTRSNKTHLYPLLFVDRLMRQRILSVQSQKMKTGAERFRAAAVFQQHLELLRENLQFVVVRLPSPLLDEERALGLQGTSHRVVVNKNDGP